MSKKISTGVVHKLPKLLKENLLVNNKALEKWENLTPLARNEWICWIISAKKIKTKERRLKRTINEVTEGKRRPCCWPGCNHRKILR